MSVKVFKPQWLQHPDDKKNRTNIYSVDFHPTQPRLATGGLGNPISDKHLCTMAVHSGAVLCVRFSPDGKYLASGSDSDNVIIIWERDTSEGGLRSNVFGSQETNREPWRCMHRLVGHTSDVVDLAWSPDSSLLASGGLDCSVIIWDSDRFEMIKKLDGHKGFVKGVAWDPAGKYLASQSDDRSVIIWNTFDWSIAKQIEQRFEKSYGETFFKRLKWSPDGSQICGVHACDQSQLIRTASIIKREIWQEDACLAGHERTIEVCAYHPFMFTADGAEDFVLLCLAGQDCSISFWTSAVARPPLVIENLFESPVFDLQWSKDGKMLAACSGEGTVALVSIYQQPFVENREINTSFGKMLPRKKVADALSKFGYKPGEEKTQKEVAISSELLEMAESAESLAKKTEELMHSRFPDIPSSGPSVELKPRAQTFASRPVNVLQVQRVSTTKDGKKRVQPVFVSSPPKEQSTTVKDTYVQLAPKPLKIHCGKPKKSYVVDIKMRDFTARICADNSTTSNVPTRFSCFIGDSSWSDYLFSPVLVAEVSSHYVVAGCEDGGVYVWTLGGRRHLPCMIIDDSVAQICLRKNHLICLSKRGALWVFDLDHKKVVLERIPLSPIASSDEKFNLSMVELNKSRVPIVTVADHRTFIYNCDMKTWQKLTVNNFQVQSINVDAFIETSSLKQHSERRQKHVQGLLKQLSSRVRSDVVKQVAISDLEEKIALALSEKATEDFQKLAIAYATRLAESNEDVESRAREFCEWISPIVNPGRETIVGVPRDELMKQVLLILSRNRRLQLLISSYI